MGGGGLELPLLGRSGLRELDLEQIVRENVSVRGVEDPREGCPHCEERQEKHTPCHPACCHVAGHFIYFFFLADFENGKLRVFLLGNVSVMSHNFLVKVQVKYISFCPKQHYILEDT